MVADMIEKGEFEMTEALQNQPIGRLGRADRDRGGCPLALQPASSFVIGVALAVDGGYTAR
jgi:hypothetical protein